MKYKIEVFDRDNDAESQALGQDFLAIVLACGDGGWYNTGIVGRAASPEAAFGAALSMARERNLAFTSDKRAEENIDETIIAWTDGGSRGNPGPSAYGIVLKGAASQQIIYECCKFIGEQTNNVAEYEGLLAALAYAVSHGIRRIQVCSDSELMVKQVRGLYRVRNSDLQALHARAMELIQKFEWFSIDHVLRSKNTEADALTNRALNAPQLYS